MRLSQFQFELPKDRIAQHPSAKREHARLMEMNRETGTLRHDRTASALVEKCQSGDVWVINDTRVRAARVYCRKPTGARVELLIIRTEDDVCTAMYRSSKPLKEGQTLIAAGHALEVLQNLGGGQVRVQFPAEVDAVLASAGQIPLPPYIDRAPTPEDGDRYQTVYANEVGAVAAPTAGLHFTPELMAAMEERGARFARITLHVGPGTFRPIRSDDIDDHVLDAERYEVSPAAAAAIASARRVVAVGTTAVRTLETLGKAGEIRACSGETGLYITPGFKFRVVDALLTNFHLPGSSLIVLVSAFAGLEHTLNAYRTAVGEGFRFYSYGDAMFIS